MIEGGENLTFVAEAPQDEVPIQTALISLTATRC
jgi:hypothetical protein